MFGNTHSIILFFFPLANSFLLSLYDFLFQFLLLSSYLFLLLLLLSFFFFSSFPEVVFRATYLISLSFLSSCFTDLINTATDSFSPASNFLFFSPSPSHYSLPSSLPLNSRPSSHLFFSSSILLLFFSSVIFSLN